MKTRWSLLKDFFVGRRPDPGGAASLDAPPPPHLKPLVCPDGLTTGLVPAPAEPDALDLLLAEPVAAEPSWPEPDAHALLLGLEAPELPHAPARATQPARAPRVQQPRLFAPPLVLPVSEAVASALSVESPLGETPFAPAQHELVPIVAAPEDLFEVAPTLPPTGDDDFDLLLGDAEPLLPVGTFLTPELVPDDLVFHTPFLPSPPPAPKRPARERRSARDRAEVLAARLIKTHKRDIAELGELANVLELGHHTLTVGAIERLLTRGASAHEVSLCFDLRCLWAQEAHFNTYYSYSRANRRRFQALSPQGLSWGLAYRLTQGFYGIPDLAELHCALEEHYDAWCAQPPYLYDSFVAYLSAVTEGHPKGLDGVHFGRYG